MQFLYILISGITDQSLAESLNTKGKLLRLFIKINLKCRMNSYEHGFITVSETKVHLSFGRRGKDLIFQKLFRYPIVLLLG